ncbi:sugar ABC transporter substrate-binding protein [[Clostridium] symbiosum]|uniref:sugar ABC transporter substrate-binding protein n=1 Tax=Clostridium symbiosum TaxID=1512 RepID=UPI001D078B49|nr:sugar ABC transporter substrate-binding protein [[Clostridium] symbiosum]MCB6609729.1 sugar ABC transporter substrate-binding protein [[Clostridium] symbiosum]MCB6929907.1 sugar ABC transporter substrate-binding protein [[Clostridium] symbiosum]
MKKMLNLALAVCLVCTSLSGCSAKESGSAAKTPETPAADAVAPADTSAPANEAGSAESASADSGKKMKIGLSVMDLSNSYFAEFSNGAQKYADENGIDLVINDPQSDTQKQVSAIENFVSSGCDAIIVSALDAESSRGAIAEAEAAGIRVITETTFIEEATSCVTFEEYNFGYALGTAAGKWISEELGGKAEYAILNQPTLPQVIERENGIRAGIEEYAPDAELAATAAANLTDTGMRAAENILQAHPDVQVILGVNDSGALGAYEAVMASGVNTDHFFVGGCDGASEALSKIKEGTIYRASAGLELPNEDIGRLCMDYAVKAANGEKLESIYYLDCVAIDGSNVDTYLTN